MNLHITQQELADAYQEAVDNDDDSKLKDLLLRAQLWKQDAAQLNKQRERRARNHRLIECGATIEHALNRQINHDDLPIIEDYIKQNADAINLLLTDNANSKTGL